MWRFTKNTTRESCVFLQIIIPYQQTVFAPVDYIPGFAVFVRCRGSNAINNESFMKMFRPMFSICSLLEVKYFDARNQHVISDSK